MRICGRGNTSKGGGTITEPKTILNNRVPSPVKTF